MNERNRLCIELGPCRVRDFEPSDAPSIAREINDRRIWINLRDQVPHPYGLADAECFLADVCAAEPRTAFAIDVGGAAVGCIGLRRNEDIERVSAEIGYWLGWMYWGRGIMTAALRAVTKHAFETFDLTRLYALPFSRNLASCRVLEKAGYLREGLLRSSVIKDGEILDQLLYSCICEQHRVEVLRRCDAPMAK